jgi:O-antigen ligase
MRLESTDHRLTLADSIATCLLLVAVALSPWIPAFDAPVPAGLPSELLLLCAGGVLLLDRHRPPLAARRFWALYLAALLVSGAHHFLRSFPLDPLVLWELRERVAGRVGLDQSSPWFFFRGEATLLFGALAYALAAGLRAGPKRLGWFLRLLVGLHCVLAGIACAQRWWHWNLPAHWLRTEPSLLRVGSVYGDPNSLGAALALVLPIAAALAWKAAGRRRILGSAAVLLIAVALGLTWSRIALAAATLALLILGAAGIRRPRLVWLYAAALAAGVLGVLLLLGSLAPEGALPYWLGKSRVNADVLAPGGRLALWSAGLRLLGRWPLLGSGPGTTYRQIGIALGSPGENLHSYPFQLAVEIGLLGLAAWALLLFRALRPAMPRAAEGPEPIELRGLRLGLLAYLATQLTGHSLLDPRHQILFWSAVGFLASASRSPGQEDRHGGGQSVAPCVSGPRPRRLVAGLAAALSACLAGTGLVRISQAWLGQDALVYELGLYPSPGSADRFRLIPSVADRTPQPPIFWCGPEAVLRLPPLGNVLQLPIALAQPDLPRHPARLELRIDGRLRLASTFERPETRILQVALTPSESRRRLVTVRARVDRTFVPASQQPDSQDWRRLGFALAPPVWSPSSAPRAVPEGWFGEEPQPDGRRLRWTGLWAAARLLPPSGPVSAGFRIAFQALHPDLPSEPLAVDLYLDGERVGTVVARQQGWYSIELPPERLAHQAPGRIVTLECSRTWVPRQIDPRSADGRALGVFVDAPAWDGTQGWRLDLGTSPLGASAGDP